MSDTVQHFDVATYASRMLGPQEQAAFEEHLRRCESCRDELAELQPVAQLLTLADFDWPDSPAGLEARTLLAVERAASADTSRGRRSPSGRARPRWTAPAVAAACLGIGILIGGVATDTERRSASAVEASATLRSGDRVASLSLSRTGIGRVVELRTDDLAILPKGEYYELWFVGPGDRPGRPNRISAGTFHPDENGRSFVAFAAAVDPKTHRRTAITAEPGDGDPAPASPDILSGRLELR